MRCEERFYNERPSSTREINKKYFFAFEGKETEPNYINSLINLKERNSLVFFYYKSLNKGDSSHPKRILDSLIDAQVNNNFKYIYSSVVKPISFFLFENNVIISEKVIESELQSFLDGRNIKFNEEINFEVMREFLKYLSNQKDEMIIDIDLLMGTIKRNTDFYEGVDEVILVADRDQESFKKEQYLYVVKQSALHNVKVFISNPCIELRFLLHFAKADKILDDDFNEAKNKAKYLFKKLKTFDKRYKKTNTDFSLYNSLIDVAIQNSALLNYDLYQLENKYGTNFPGLINLIDNMK